MSVFSQLLSLLFIKVSSERRNIQLVCEKQCLTMDIQRVQDAHARESKRRDWEESLMNTQIQELKYYITILVLKQQTVKQSENLVILYHILTFVWKVCI